MRFGDLAGRRVVVWGWGREGRAVAQRCRELGVDVVAAVTGSPSPEPGVLDGDDALAALRAADVVVKSPGIPVATGPYGDLAAAGVAFTSLMDLWLGDHHRRTIGVTGTKGKSTTTTAIGHLLRAVGRPAEVLGNIGRQVLDETADASTDTSTAVVEFSSYQAQSLSLSPRLGVVTSLFPEHVPWHGSVEAYYTDKLHLVATSDDVVVPGTAPDLVARVRAAAPDARLHVTGPDTPHVDDEGGLTWPGVGSLTPGALSLRGRHNVGNLALALLAVEVWTGGLTDAERSDALAAAATVPTLAHRLETIPSADGRTWVDDSLATAPEAVVAALAAWPDEPVALVVGGADRGLDFTPLAGHLAGAGREVHLLLIGPAGARFAAEHAHALGDAGVDVRTFEGLAGAVAWATSEANPAQVVLFSPGAPSFDEFTDYEHRSRALRAMLAQG